jgi:hypothetical protein
VGMTLTELARLTGRAVWTIRTSSPGFSVRSPVVVLTLSTSDSAETSSPPAAGSFRRTSDGRGQPTNAACLLWPRLDTPAG